MSAHIHTYVSRNAPPEEAWLAYIEKGGRTIGVRFTGATEDEVKAKVRAFYAEEQAKGRRQRGGK